MTKIVPLDPPKGMHKTTSKAMFRAFMYLYLMRVFLLDHLAALLGLTEHDVRRKLERYPYINVQTKSVTLYRNKVWITLSRVNVYTLSRDVVVAWETKCDRPSYSLKPTKNPEPDAKSLDTYILLSELWTRVGCRLDLWAPLSNTMFEDRLVRIHGERARINVPIAMGIGFGKSGQIHYGIGLLTQKNQISSYLKRTFPEPYQEFYQAVLFTVKSIYKEVIAHARRHAKHVMILIYESMIDNVGLFQPALLSNSFWMLEEVSAHYTRMGYEVHQIIKGRWTPDDSFFRLKVVSPTGEVEYFDTTVGRSVQAIDTMATDRNVKGTLWVSSQEELDTWKEISRQSFSRIKYQIINWPIPKMYS